MKKLIELIGGMMVLLLLFVAKAPVLGQNTEDREKEQKAVLGETKRKYLEHLICSFYELDKERKKQEKEVIDLEKKLELAKKKLEELEMKITNLKKKIAQLLELEIGVEVKKEKKEEKEEKEEKEKPNKMRLTGWFRQFSILNLNKSEYLMIMEIERANNEFSGKLYWPTLGETVTEIQGRIIFCSGKIYWKWTEQKIITGEEKNFLLGGVYQATWQNPQIMTGRYFHNGRQKGEFFLFLEGVSFPKNDIKKNDIKRSSLKFPAYPRPVYPRPQRRTIYYPYPSQRRTIYPQRGRFYFYFRPLPGYYFYVYR